MPVTVICKAAISSAPQFVGIKERVMQCYLSEWKIQMLNYCLMNPKIWSLIESKNSLKSFSETGTHRNFVFHTYNITMAPPTKKQAVRHYKCR